MVHVHRSLSAPSGGGLAYGSALEPADRSSGGGAGSGPYSGGSQGGGAIRLMVGGTLTVNGWLSAIGYEGWQDNSGGGSGGSIWVTTRMLTGNGVICADGGPGELFDNAAVNMQLPFRFAHRVEAVVRRHRRSESSTAGRG